MKTPAFRSISPFALALTAAAHSAVGAAPLRQVEAAPNRLASANRAALREPQQSRFVNAVQVYAWTEGAVYRLYTALDQLSTISLQPGEQLVSVAAGDTARWVIGVTSSGSGPSRRTHILVKPSQTGLKTNLIITTDRRIYLLLVSAGRGPAMTAMSWTYPQDELLALKAQAAAKDAALPVAGDVAVDRLNFNYAISGDRPAWRPLRVFDDGAQVFVEFPPDLAAGEAPPLFVLGATGKAELVNYRLRGRYYVVDRLFWAAELRLGEKRQSIVRITRKGSR